MIDKTATSLCQPLFVLGNPRSGTTLYRLMLTSHSQILIPPESHFFLWWYEKYQMWHISDGFEQILDDIFTSTKIETWHLDRDRLSEALHKHSPSSYGELVKHIYLSFDLEKSPIYWGDKNSLWVDKFPAIRSTFPNATVLHIIRDGRDVACSYRKLAQNQLTSRYSPRLPSNIQTIAETWSRNNEAISAFGKSLGFKQYIKIRYEDLVSDPQIPLSQVIEFLGLDFESEMLKYPQQIQQKALEPPAFFAWKKQILTPPNPANIGKFHSELTESQINLFNSVAQKTLIENGYL